MFDIIWTDPDRELVGQRDARKRMETHFGRTQLDSAWQQEVTEESGDRWKEIEAEEAKQAEARMFVSAKSCSSSADTGSGLFGFEGWGKKSGSSKDKERSQATASPSLRSSNLDQKKKKEEKKRGSVYSTEAGTIQDLHPAKEKKLSAKPSTTPTFSTQDPEKPLKRLDIFSDRTSRGKY